MWQLSRQFPFSLEFGERLLLTLFDNAYASAYGTFLCNSEKERRVGREVGTALSLRSDATVTAVPLGQTLPWPGQGLTLPSRCRIGQSEALPLTAWVKLGPPTVTETRLDSPVGACVK